MKWVQMSAKYHIFMGHLCPCNDTQPLYFSLKEFGFTPHTNKVGDFSHWCFTRMLCVCACARARARACACAVVDVSI